MMISLPNNLQSGQEPKAGVKDATGGAIDRNYRDAPSLRMIWPDLGGMQITNAPIVQATQRSKVA